jgi:hypothetical protein
MDWKGLKVAFAITKGTAHNQNTLAQRLDFPETGANDGG